VQCLYLNTLADEIYLNKTKIAFLSHGKHMLLCDKDVRLMVLMLRTTQNAMHGTI
jgi:hypothetical protein